MDIPRILFDLGPGVAFSRRQYPIRLGYAGTVNRTQGRTITGRYVADLRTQAFAAGATYVALSRTPSPNQVSVLLPKLEHGQPEESRRLVSVICSQLLISDQYDIHLSTIRRETGQVNIDSHALPPSAVTAAQMAPPVHHDLMHDVYIDAVE